MLSPPQSLTLPFLTFLLLLLLTFLLLLHPIQTDPHNTFLLPPFLANSLLRSMT